MYKVDAIYVRQSVDRVDSISIESQVEFCKNEVKGSEFQVYQDKGYSGKNVERPAFQEMMADITKGKIKRVVVYRLDRISRSVLDFASVIDIFQKSGVGFVSTMEKFDTGTPVGNAMLMVVMIFAQLERETIQQRVSDAYHSRSKRGFYMGGKIPYGYGLVETTIDGVKTKKYEPILEEATVVQQVFGLYAHPQVSLGDIARCLQEQQICKRDGSAFSRSRIRDMIVNPVYVMADYRIYEFFKAQGTNIINSPEEFMGTNGAYLYSGVEKKRRTISLEGHDLVLAPHQGFVDAGTWLKCRNKCLNNSTVAKPLKAKATWLAGKIKCANCGYALSAKTYHCKTKKDNRYYLCNHKYNAGKCDFGSLDADVVDEIVFEEMKKKLEGFQVLTKKQEKIHTLQTIQIKTDIEKIDEEVTALLGRISQANEVVMEYINGRILELDKEKKGFLSELIRLENRDETSCDEITGYMNQWDEISMSDKLTVVDSLIKNIYASKDGIKINWKI